MPESDYVVRMLTESGIFGRIEMSQPLPLNEVSDERIGFLKRAEEGNF